MSKKFLFFKYSVARIFESEQVVVELLDDDSFCATRYSKSSRPANAPLPIRILTDLNKKVDNG